VPLRKSWVSDTAKRRSVSNLLYTLFKLDLISYSTVRKANGDLTSRFIMEPL
jgi:hypothetical protein